MKKKIGILLMFGMILNLFITMTVSAISETELSSKLQTLKTHYPSGTHQSMFYNSSFNGSSCYKDLSGWSSWECMAWGSKVYDYLWATSIRYGNFHQNANNIYIGDYIRYATGTYDHSIVITNIVGNTVFYTDCNGYQSAAKIQWDRQTTKADLQTKIQKELKNAQWGWDHGYIVHYPGNTIQSLNHTHSYTTYVYNWAQHPHYSCYKCWCGEVKENTSEPNVVESCSQCKTHTHVFNTYVYNWAQHPHYKCYKCSCGEVKSNKNEPTFLMNCAQCTKHTVFVNPNGGEWNGSKEIQSFSGTYGSTKDIPDPRREGYIFAGWTISSLGGVCFNDPTFAGSNNGIKVYNYENNGKVTHDFVEKDADCPTDTTRVLKITTNGTARPALGGFMQETAAGANKVYYQVVVAKIPKGYTINHGKNSCGNGATFEWLTPQEGTGKYETYIHRTVCGADGTMDSEALGYIYLDGPKATAENPVTWYVGYSNVFDGSNNVEAGTGQYAQYGKPLFNDTLLKDNNYIGVYNNLKNGSVVVEKVEKNGEPDLLTNKVFKITTSGSARPGHGGFDQVVAAGANKTFYQIIVAKIPKGYTINHGNNSCGDGAIFEWLTPQEGTGEYETYIHRTVCGATGTMDSSALGYIYLDGPTATAENPVTWYVGYSNVFDATESTQEKLYKLLSGNDILTATWRLDETNAHTKSIVQTNNDTHIINTKLYYVYDNRTVVVSGYKSGEYITNKKTVYNGKSINTTLTGDIDQIKVFVWENMNTLKPICDAEVISSGK